MENTKKKQFFETDPQFYRSILTLYIPLMLQSLLRYSVTTVDSIMLGHLSEISMSAANIANQPFNIVTGLIIGLTVGSGIMISQYWGKNDIANIRRTLTTAIKLCVALSTVMAVIVFAIPKQIMSFYTSEMNIVNEGFVYLRIISITFILYSFSQTYMLAIRSMEDAKAPLLINIITYAVNIFLNWCFIYGRCGLPALGINGVAIGTLIARIIEFLGCVIHMFVINKHLGLKLSSFAESSGPIRNGIVKYGLPNMMAETVFTVGITMYTLIFGHLGTAATAANTIVTMSTRINETLFAGLTGAASVLIGKTIGEKKMDKVMTRGNTFILLGFILCLFSMGITFLAKNFILSLYSTVSPETYALANKLITIAICLFPGYTYETLFVVGILVGGGDTKFIFWYTTIVMWCITIPAAMLAAFVFNWSTPVVFAILKCDYVIKGLVGFVRFFSKKWYKDVTV